MVVGGREHGNVFGSLRLLPQLGYASWTADPKTEAQRKADAEKRRRLGHKTPPVPLLYPVALRPDDVAAARKAQYERLVAEFKPAIKPELAGGGKLEKVKPRDLAALLGF